MKKGRLIAIVGCMFSGKTTELLRRIEREELANREALLFKPDIDKRYSPDKVCSHSGLEEDAICLETDIPSNILTYLEADTEVVAIEEVQFFNSEIVDIVNELIDNGIDVFVSGLDLDFKGEVFGYTYILMAYADKVLKLSAVCMVEGCGNEASRTQRLSNDKEVVSIGEKDKYEARCRDHYKSPK